MFHFEIERRKSYHSLDICKQKLNEMLGRNYLSFSFPATLIWAVLIPFNSQKSFNFFTFFFLPDLGYNLAA